MKLLISAYSCKPNEGGESGNGFNCAVYNALYGNETFCITGIQHKDELLRYKEEKKINNLHFVFVPIPVSDTIVKSVGSQGKYYLWQYYAYKEAKKLNKVFNFDVVHHITWGSMQLGSFMYRLRKPLLFGPVGGGQKASPLFKEYFEEFWGEEVKRELVSKLFIWFNPAFKKTIKKAAITLVTNEESYKIAKDNGAKIIKYSLDSCLPENFYPKEFPDRLLEKKLKILWLGRLMPRKGLKLVLETLSKVSAEIDFELTIVGSGQISKYLPEYIANFGLEKKVNCVGTVPFEQIKSYYLSHNLFFFCSLRDSFASQYLEAMAYGLPILTLNHQGAKVFIPDNASIKVTPSTPVETVSNLKEAVSFLHNNPDKRLSMGKHAYEFAVKQNWDLKVKEFNELYLQVVDLQNKKL